VHRCERAVDVARVERAVGTVQQPHGSRLLSALFETRAGAFEMLVAQIPQDAASRRSQGRSIRSAVAGEWSERSPAVSV